MLNTISISPSYFVILIVGFGLIFALYDSISIQRLEELYTILPIQTKKPTTRYCNLHSSPPILPRCYLNNTYCGDWDIQNRSFIPAKNPENSSDHDQCTFRLFTPAEARQCLGNRTLTFVGDSLIRDLAIGIGLFLQGRTIEESLDVKFDRQDLFALDGWMDQFFLDMWGVEDGQSYAWIFPAMNQTNQSKNDSSVPFEFQIQYWHLFCRENMLFRVGTSGANHINDLIDGTVLKDTMAQQYKMRPTDYFFWSYGLHDEGYWWTEPYTELFHNNILGVFGTYVPHFKYPAVWVSMNTRCKDMIPDEFKTQYIMMNTVNQELGARLQSEKLPYYDADLFLRTPQNCNVTGDSLHVKMWVDLYRARSFFNYICDENNHWVGNSTAPFLV